MGAVVSSKRKKRKKKKNELTFYETSDEHWVFGKKHLNAIRESLQIIQLEMMYEVILEYLSKVNIAEWNHPNYSTFIHTSGTPLNNDLSPVFQSPWDADFKVMMMGDAGVGKSALTMRFITNDFHEDIDPTIEDSYQREFTINAPKKQYDEWKADGTQKIMVEVFDTVCTEESASMYDYYDSWFREINIYILVFSVVDKESFKMILPFRNRIERLRVDWATAIIVVGNKCDLRADRKFDGDAVYMDDVFEWCKQNNYPYIETSAKNGKNVNLLFRQCVYEYQWKEKLRKQSKR